MEKYNFAERLESAWAKATETRIEAASLMYLTIIKSLESFSDVEFKLLDSDNMNLFLKQWINLTQKDGSSALSLEHTENGINILRCQFDLFLIRDTLQILNDEEFGFLDMKKIESSLLSSLDGKIPNNQIENSIQKVKKPNEINKVINV